MFRNSIPCILLVAVGILGLIPVIGTAESDSSSLVKKIRVMHDDGTQMTGGEVEFFESGEFVMRSVIDADGYVELDRGKLQPGSTYTISVLNTDYDEIYVINNWLYDPGEFDPVWDEELGHNKYILAPILQGLTDKGLSIKANRRDNPEWQEANDRRIGKQKEGPQKYVVAVFLPFAFGRFGADENALPGVPEVKPLFGLAVSYRHGFPSRPVANAWIRYREMTISYASNRYTTDQALDPGEQSDVTFHRASVSYGLGFLKSRSQMSAALALAYGGIYDKGSVITFLDREYSLFGVGLHCRYIFTALSTGGIDFGLMGQAELMYYPVGDHPAGYEDKDHWYGLAPTLAIGVVVH